MLKLGEQRETLPCLRRSEDSIRVFDRIKNSMKQRNDDKQPYKKRIMHQTTFISRSMLTSIVRLTCSITVVLLLMTASVKAQATSTNYGGTPTGLAPGAPTGSYSLSGFENVNLFNGNLNFNLEMIRIGGRGSAGMPVSLSVDSVHWTVRKEASEVSSGGECGFSDNLPCPYQPIGTPGPWNGGPYYDPVPEWRTNLRVGYGPGVLQGQGAITRGPFNSSRSIIKFTFTASDGTEYVLRDVLTGGQPLTGTTRDRGTVFTTADGTSVTFVSNVAIDDLDPNHPLTQPHYPTGYMITADGTRYEIENGKVMSIHDRNGNQLTFGYIADAYWNPETVRVHTITDSLGRVVTINYADFTNGPAYDSISFTGFGGSVTRVIKVWRTSLGQALRTTQSGDATAPATLQQLFPEMQSQSAGGNLFNPPSTSDSVWDPGVASAVELPDGRQYKLYYNQFNELARIELPSGGAIEYDYTPTGTSAYFSNASIQIQRRVTKRRMYSSASTSTYESMQTYTPTYTATHYNTGGYADEWETTIEVKQYGSGTSLDGAGAPLLSKSKHYFYGSPVASLTHAGITYPGWKEGRETKTESLSPDGILLRRVENLWKQCDPNLNQCQLSIAWWTGTGDKAPANNPNLSETVTTLMDVSPNLVSKQTFLYDKYNNLTDTFDYDFNPSVAATYPVRHTKTDYLTSNVDYTDASVHLRSLPTMQRVYSVNPANGAETLAAKSETVYDDPTYQVSESYSSLTGWSTPATAARGNATTSRAWYDVNSSSAYIETHVQYDQAGNVRKMWDGRNKMSEIEYSATYNYALPTHTKSPPASAPGSELETSSVYDFSSGLVTSTTDANGQSTYVEYNDVLGRPTKVTRPTGGGWTSYEYGDTVGSLYLRTQTSLDSSHTLEAHQYFDGLGRVTRSSQTEGGSFILADTEYDALGRVLKISNPYRTDDALQWTTNTYDALGRVTIVKTPDNAELLSSFSGNTVTITDQAGKQRRSVTDVLGRLTSVNEAPNDTTSYNFQTSYAYDVLGNLRTVTQGSQARTFAYDSLSRMTSATNPETGTIAYAYDANGNLLTKTDARLTMATYIYDGLNRVTQSSYGNGTAVATPTVTYGYDSSSASNSKGKLTSVSSDVSAYNYTGYDAVGRVTASQQVTDGRTYSMGYQYDLAGNMTSQTYPTGRVVSQTFDNTGRLVSVNGQSSGGTPKTYANSFGYTAHGAVERMRLGNGRWEHTSYDPKRLQPLEIGLGASATNSNLLKLQYDYGTSDNNGNVKSQTITIPNMTSPLVQTYLYDALNRIDSAIEVSGTTQSWKQKYVYDKYGNRRFDSSQTSVPDSQSNQYITNPQIDVSNNRFSSGQGYIYDLAGNLTQDAQGRTFIYDAENKQTEAKTTSSSSTIAKYFYGGDGKRVKKYEPVSTQTTLYVYNASGQMVAEYTINVTPPTNPETRYLTTDTLGTPRIITSGSGIVKERHDYMPFGEEVYFNTSLQNVRTTAQGYSDDAVRQKFTSKERDIETGLDYFGARYYASTQGRFTSADPLLNSGRPQIPQTWNRYSYTRNSPLARIDPTGLYDLNNTCGAKDKKCNEEFDKSAQRLKKGIAKVEKKVEKMKESVEKARLQASLAALGHQGDHNNVTVTFGALAGGASSHTDVSVDEAGVSSYAVTFDESKVTGQNGQIIDALHEGTHISDFEDPRYASGELSDFSSEYRAFQTSAWTASVLGESSLSFGKQEIWNKSWKAVDDKVLTKYIIDTYKYAGGKPYLETIPHDPWPH